MKYLTLLCLIFSSSLFAKQYLAPINLNINWEKVAKRCQYKEAPPVYAEDFQFNSFVDFGNGGNWFANQKEMSKRYRTLYRSKKRLVGRAYYDPQLQQFVLPLKSGTGDDEDRVVELPQNFIENITIHIEQALKSNLAEFIFFPDMGHNHFFVTKDYYQENIKGKADRLLVYQALFASPDLRMLYHTAEKLMLEDGEGPLDPCNYRRHRYNTRNIVGSYDKQGILEVVAQNDGSYNTVRDYKDYASYSAGVYFHASKNGCFPFKDGLKTRYFDISLFYFPYQDLSSFN